MTDAAEQLAAQVQAHLPDGALATTDPDRARTGALGAVGAVLVGPPSLQWGGYLAAGCDAVWQLTCVTSPGASLRDAWDRLELLLEGITAAGVPLARATPGSMSDPTGTELLPAYIVTTDTTALGD